MAQNTPPTRMVAGFVCSETAPEHLELSEQGVLGRR